MKLGNVLILGDSYSTFEGCIPNGYACYYIAAGKPETDVTEKEQTWWAQLIQETGANLVMNNSWSGSTICNTGYDQADFTHESFITRVDELIENEFFQKNEIDTVFIFGGTNDSWAGSPVGSLQFENWSKKDLYEVLPATCYLLHRLKTATPVKRIVVLVNTLLSPAVEKGLIEAAEHYQVDCVRFQKIAKACGHPTIQGMRDIKNELLQKL